MSKKFIILITILILIIVLFFGFSYLTKDNTNTNQNTENSNKNFFSDIFNFGNITQNETVNNIVDFVTGNNEEKEGDIEEVKKLYKISSMPITGYGILEKEVYIEVPDLLPEEVDFNEGNQNQTEAPKTEFISVIRYADKRNGNIYENQINKTEERKYSNTEIFKVHESLFTNRNTIMRYLKNNDTIVTFLGEISKDVIGGDSENAHEIFGSFLPDGIKDISVSKEKNEFFYLTNSRDGVIGNLINEKGEKIQVFNSSFSEWNSHFPNKDYVILNTRPSGLVDGFSYILNLKNKDFNKILGNIKGLTTLSNNTLSTILYSDNNLSIKLFDLSREETRNLRLRTHPEKCVWSNDNVILYCAIPKEIEADLIYPDAWYQGEVSYNDEIWKIDTYTGAKTKLIDPNTLYENENIDAINLSLDKDEKTLFFMNKVDSYLWALRLD
ncbi:MAG: hypothetical protein KBD14_00185 [Candidatus Pacebacteria bacterium]|nr:hypothetical protein [Candidatus Paceibacterota bacterium]